MAGADTAAAAAARLEQVAAIYTGASMVRIANAVGKGAKTEATNVAASVTGGDGRLSHMGRRGARLSSGYDVEEGGRRVVVKLRPPGPWVLVEQGAKGHAIRAKRKRAIHGGSYPHPVARRVGRERPEIHHPGAKGKGAIRRTFARIRDRASVDAHREVVRALEAIY